MEKIKSGKFVELVYDVYEVFPNVEDQLVHSMTEEEPERFIFGVTPGLIPDLEKALDGLEEGNSFDVTIPEAFGPFDPEQIAVLPRDVFFIDGKFDDQRVKPGSVLPMMTADGYRVSGMVLEVDDNNVKMDFNHPLAGKTVRFKGRVKVVREATPEELQPAHGCGCGSCGSGSCGEGCGEGCDSGCGCN